MPEIPERRAGRPPVLEAGERRQAILAAAERVFTDCGYADASMAAIARQAGMSKKTLYAIFPNKRALFETLAYDAEAFAQLELIDDGPPREALRRSLRNTVLFALSPRQILATRLLIASNRSEVGLAASFRDNVIAKAQRHHARLLSALMREHGRPDQDCEQMARQIFGLVIADLHILALVGVEIENVETLIERQLDAAMNLLDGLLVRET